MRRLLFWLGYVWALPVTLVGFMFAALTRCDLEGFFMNAAVFRASPWLQKQFFERFGMAAFTWGGCIVFDARMRSTESHLRILNHEIVHFLQARIFGALMPVAYGVGSLVALARGKNAYQDNPLEVWARKAAGE